MVQIEYITDGLFSCHDRDMINSLLSYAVFSIKDENSEFSAAVLLPRRLVEKGQKRTDFIVINQGEDTLLRTKYMSDIPKEDVLFAIGLVMESLSQKNIKNIRILVSEKMNEVL